MQHTSSSTPTLDPPASRNYLQSMLAGASMGLACGLALGLPCGLVLGLASLPTQRHPENADVGTFEDKPSALQVLGAGMWGIDYSELDTKNEADEALSTTPLEALDTDNSAAEQAEPYSQNIYVCNHDTADYLCIGATTWVDTCGAGDMTCRSGATTDGLVVSPETCRAVRFLGTERPCIQGTAAISAYDIERVTYLGPQP